MNETKEPIAWTCPHCGDSSEVLVRCTVEAYMPNFVTVGGSITVTGPTKIDWDSADTEVVFCSECGEEIEEMEIVYDR